MRRQSSPSLPPKKFLHCSTPCLPVVNHRKVFPSSFNPLLFLLAYRHPGNLAHLHTPPPFNLTILLKMAHQKTAILSVYDKTGLLDLAKGLVDNNVRILASGGTAKMVRGAGFPVE